MAATTTMHGDGAGRPGAAREPPRGLTRAMALTRGPAGSFLLGRDPVVDLGILSDGDAVAAAVVHAGTRVAAGAGGTPSFLSAIRVPFLNLENTNVGVIVGMNSWRPRGGGAGTNMHTRRLGMGRYACDSETGEMLAVVTDVRPGQRKTVSLVWMGPATCEYVRERVDIVCEMERFSAGKFAESIISLERTTRVGGGVSGGQLPSGPRDMTHLAEYFGHYSGPTQDFIAGAPAFQENLAVVTGDGREQRFLESAVQCQMAGLPPPRTHMTLRAELLSVGQEILVVQMGTGDVAQVRAPDSSWEQRLPGSAQHGGSVGEDGGAGSRGSAVPQAMMGGGSSSGSGSSGRTPPRYSLSPDTENEYAVPSANASWADTIADARHDVLTGMRREVNAQVRRDAAAVRFGSTGLGRSWSSGASSFVNGFAFGQYQAATHENGEMPVAEQSHLIVPPPPATMLPSVAEQLSAAVQPPVAQQLLGADQSLATEQLRLADRSPATQAPPGAELPPVAAKPPARQRTEKRTRPKLTERAAGKTADKEEMLAKRRLRNIESAKRSNARRKCAAEDLQRMLSVARTSVDLLRTKESMLRSQNAELHRRFQESNGHNRIS